MPDPINNSVVFVVGVIAADTGELTNLLAAGVGRTQCFTRGAPFIEYAANEFDGDDACLLLDLSVEDMSALDVMAGLRQNGCETPVIIVASQTDVRSAVQAMQAGAIDLFERPIAWEIVLPRIRSALELNRRHRQARSRRDNVQLRWKRLSRGERAVARLVCDGMASREIGASLGLGRRTIENRRASIMFKMGVSSVAELVRAVCGVGPDFPPAEDSPIDAASADRR